MGVGTHLICKLCWLVVGVPWDILNPMLDVKKKFAAHSIIVLLYMLFIAHVVLFHMLHTAHVALFHMLHDCTCCLIHMWLLITLVAHYILLLLLHMLLESQCNYACV